MQKIEHNCSIVMLHLVAIALVPPRHSEYELPTSYTSPIVILLMLLRKAVYKPIGRDTGDDRNAFVQDRHRPTNRNTIMLLMSEGSRGLNFSSFFFTW